MMSIQTAPGEGEIFAVRYRGWHVQARRHCGGWESRICSPAPSGIWTTFALTATAEEAMADGKRQVDIRLEPYVAQHWREVADIPRPLPAGKGMTDEQVRDAHEAYLRYLANDV